jgi:2,4-dienoyl-CoA reductase-like NADH-dependent reductase (Old Yellow Enzyme family)/siroheme synthase (precorrin-2 oxidase/ferrochelatase)
MTNGFPHLLSPLEVGPKTLRNRVLVTAHVSGVEDNGLAGDAFIAYHTRRARGGAGLQMSGTSRFHRTGHVEPIRGLDLLHPDIEPGLARLAESIHREGGTFLVQLGHAAATLDYGDIGQPLWAPSAVASDLMKVVPRAMSRDEIAEVIAAYGAAARTVRAAGLDGVEILAAFGFLPGAFFSPLTNKRGDDYGGDLTGRVRFALETAEAVRAAVGPELIVGMRIPGDEMAEGGLAGDDMVEIAQALAAAGTLDYLNVTAGTNYDRIMRWEHWPASPAPHGLFAPLAARIRKAVEIPVFVTGRVTDPALAEAILARGDADMVGMTRAHIADPDIVTKAEAGRVREIRPCVGANVCINRAVNGKSVRCFYNPEAGRELAFAGDAPSGRAKRIAVIGGGPAGLEAARLGAERGHQVTLYEAGDQLGGQLRLWAASPFAREYALSLEWYARELARRQVRVHLNQSVSAEELAGLEADAVIIATGSRPAARAPLPGEKDCGIAVLTAAEILAGADLTQARHAVVVDEGGGRNALAAAEVLAEAGVAVTIVTADAAVAERLDGTVKTQLYRFLLSRGVTFRPMEAVTGLAQGKVLMRNIYSGQTGEIADVDLLVDWRGNESLDDLAEAARRHAGEVHVVGDSLAPRTVQLAVAEGAEAIRKLS